MKNTFKVNIFKAKNVLFLNPRKTYNKEVHTQSMTDLKIMRTEPNADN